MLTFEQIKELIDQVASHRLSSFELERSGFRLKIDGMRLEKPGESMHRTLPGLTVVSPPHEAAAAVHAPSPSGEVLPAAPPAGAPAAGAPAAGAKPGKSADLHVLKSPIIGTFYRAPNPDSPPFVEIGDRVKKGQVLCIVEAMKLMNEIEADVDGTILEIHVENAQPVEYGEPLFAIQAG